MINMDKIYSKEPLYNMTGGVEELQEPERLGTTDLRCNMLINEL